MEKITRTISTTDVTVKAVRIDGDMNILQEELNLSFSGKLSDSLLNTKITEELKSLYGESSNASFAVMNKTVSENLYALSLKDFLRYAEIVEKKEPGKVGRPKSQSTETI